MELHQTNKYNKLKETEFETTKQQMESKINRLDSRLELLTKHFGGLIDDPEGDVVFNTKGTILRAHSSVGMH